VNRAGLSDAYRAYIDCLNEQNWPKLERDYSEIPDLTFDVQMLISDPPYIASRLGFDCTPKGTFLGLLVNGRRVSFTENVFYPMPSFAAEVLGRYHASLEGRL
jgi:predicted ester cyclase